MDEKKRIRNLFIRQNEYFQYLYEQEQKRSASIVAGAKVYITFLVFILGSIFLKVITADKILLLFNSSSVPPWEKVLGFSLIILCAIALLIALIFSIFVLKVWSYDRLCNPVERTAKNAAAEFYVMEEKEHKIEAHPILIYDTATILPGMTEVTLDFGANPGKGRVNRLYNLDEPKLIDWLLAHSRLPMERSCCAAWVLTILSAGLCLICLCAI